jgi:hypothetical protein
MCIFVHDFVGGPIKTVPYSIVKTDSRYRGLAVAGCRVNYLVPTIRWRRPPSLPPHVAVEADDARTTSMVGLTRAPITDLFGWHGRGAKWCASLRMQIETTGAAWRSTARTPVLRSWRNNGIAGEDQLPQPIYREMRTVWR